MMSESAEMTIKISRPAMTVVFVCTMIGFIAARVKEGVYKRLIVSLSGCVCASCQYDDQEVNDEGYEHDDNSLAQVGRVWYPLAVAPEVFM